MQPPLDSGSGYHPGPSDDAVQCTHVDAANAKLSCAKLGYFEDPWQSQLMRNTRPQARSPLIHRGYYSRVEIIRRSVQRFLSLCPGGAGVQIVNLGAGLDSLYFWLRSDKDRWRDDLVCFEVDFAEILSKKLTAVLKHQTLWPLVDAEKQEDIVWSEMSSAGTRELRTKHLKYVSADMRMIPELEGSLVAAGFRSDLPTLFLSECVMGYMQSLHGDSIIAWAGSAVPDAPSAMVTYEQTNPNDPFGKMMVHNMMDRGCPLLSIHDYPSLEAQRDRYQARKWDRCALADMNEVYRKHLDQKDVQRIQKIEFLDELEEWYLIQGHYFLLTATRSPGGDGNEWIHDLWDASAGENAAAA